MRAVVALGANLGDRQAAITSAARALDDADGVRLVALSPLFTTAAVGPPQPDYLNAVALLRTSLPAADLLGLCHRIEADHGRVRRERWGPRTLDLDLLAVGEPGDVDEVLSDTPGLRLPHPRAHERAFVLAPWVALDPAARLRLPDGRIASARELLAELLAGLPAALPAALPAQLVDKPADRDGVRPFAPEVAR